MGRLSRGLLPLLVIAAACGADVVSVGAPVVATVTPAPAPTAEAPATLPETPTPVPSATPAGVEATPPVEVGAGFVLPLRESAVGALMTATGIPVEILAVAPTETIVRTPCGQTAALSSGEPMDDVQVVLDPGHGGPVDTGAVGVNGLIERDLNMTLARATEAELLSRGISVALTRTRDYHTLLPTRTAFADALGARALVSIHHNAPAGNPSNTPGTEIFVQTGSDESRRLGGVLYETVFEALSTIEGVEWTTAPDAGVVRVLNSRGGDAYGMIRRPTTPAALVELAYINNPSEAVLLATDTYIQIASAALADGIAAYLLTETPGSGYIETPRVFDPAFAPGADVCTDPPLE